MRFAAACISFDRQLLVSPSSLLPAGHSQPLHTLRQCNCLVLNNQMQSALEPASLRLRLQAGNDFLPHVPSLDIYDRPSALQASEVLGRWSGEMQGGRVGRGCLSWGQLVLLVG